MIKILKENNIHRNCCACGESVEDYIVLQVGNTHVNESVYCVKCFKELITIGYKNFKSEKK